MRQKYMILKDDENGKLIIRELAELDKEMFSMLCEETYEKNKIKHDVTNTKIKNKIENTGFRLKTSKKADKIQIVIIK